MQTKMQSPAALANTGSAEITASLNTWPVITSTNATPGYLTKGAQTMLAVAASDPDGDPITYTWASTCLGTFANSSTATPGFTLATGETKTACTMTVHIADNRGGGTDGALTLNVGGTPAILAPAITFSLQSADVVGSNSPVTLTVNATDPQNRPIGFSWSASGGTLGTPSNTAESSQVVWTSPATPAPVWNITVVVSNGTAISSKTFTVTASTLR